MSGGQNAAPIHNLPSRLLKIDALHDLYLERAVYGIVEIVFSSSGGSVTALNAWLGVPSIMSDR